jgi:hypothetical protein
MMLDRHSDFALVLQVACNDRFALLYLSKEDIEALVARGPARPEFLFAG